MDVRDIFAHRMDDRFTRLDIAVPKPQVGVTPSQRRMQPSYTSQGSAE